MFKIIDNFLSPRELNIFKQQTILNKAFPVYRKDDIAYTNSNDGIYFTHTFADDKQIKSKDFDILEPILNKLQPSQIIRIQFNLYPKSFFKVKHKFHTDFPVSHKGCILYLNTNNGETILKNKPFNIGIKSIENRALFFDPYKKHRSTTCTDKQYRANIIFNYI
tara:strand:- start:69 stop:560 length:492 start_codon:yes stop_codon:yes gene_type:complete